jgi:hypothetical protein
MAAVLIDPFSYRFPRSISIIATLSLTLRHSPSLSVSLRLFLSLLQVLRRFRPELVIISAGFDAHKDDPLAELRLVAEDYEWVTARLKVGACIDV